MSEAVATRTEPLRVKIEGPRPAFSARARWVLEAFAEALGRRAVFGGHAGGADLAYAPARPDGAAVWIPADPAAQAFFEGDDPFPSRAVHRARGLALLFPPTHPQEPIPGDIVASAFYLMSRWDEHVVPLRDAAGRLPLSASAFGQIAGLGLERPAVESYIDALRAALRIRPPARWGVAVAGAVDRVRLRTPLGMARVARRRGLAGLARTLAGPDPWDNLPDLLEATWRRGLRSTIFIPGRDAPGLGPAGRRRLVAAVRAAGGEAGCALSGAAIADPAALARELEAVRRAGAPAATAHVRRMAGGRRETAMMLEDAGVRALCGGGFAEAPGFARGLARPVRPWVHGAERPAGYVEIPLAVTDVALCAELGLDPEDAGARALRVLEAVRRAGGRAALLWHNTTLAGAAGPGHGPLFEELVDELARRGAELGPVGAPEPRPAGARLDGVRAMHLTTVHRPRDVRIFHKEARALARAGARAVVGAPRARLPRAARPLAGWRLMAAARREGADIYHVHDPELLPVALWLARSTGAPVVYDAHEYLGQTARTKAWLPAPLRLPIAVAAERAERAAARRLAAVVTSNEDLAARFAAGGARAVSVANSPWADSFPEPEPAPAEPVVLYVGGIGPLRGMPLMRAAFPMVDAPGARLVLAGPGDPGPDLPHGVEHVGVVDHSAVPALLAACAVAWIPLQRHGNYDRAVPTKLIEAMAAGRPVVASDLGRMSAIVRAAGCGIIVPPADAEAHAHALTHLLRNPEAAAAMGRAGRRAFLEGLDFDTEARSLTALYAEILHDDRR